MTQDSTQSEEVRIENRSRFYWFILNTRAGIKRFISNFRKNRPVIFILLLVVMVYALFVGRSGYQPMFLAIRKYWLLVAIILFILWIYIRAIKKRTFVKSLIPTILVAVILVGSYLGGPPVYRYLSLFNYYQILNKVELVDLAETGFERIQPRMSIQTLINQEALEETEDATKPKFVRDKDGKYYFTSAVGPAVGYRIQQLSKDMYKVIQVNANLPSPDFSGKAKQDVEFKIGDFLLFSKNVETAVRKKLNWWQFFTCELGEPIYMRNNQSTWVQVVPLVKWEGFLFPRPVFGGVIVINQGNNPAYLERVLLGAGTYVSPQQIKLNAYLLGQNLMSEKVCTYIAESFRFTRGFFAPFPGNREGDIRIPSMENNQASQPFVTYFDLNFAPKLYNYFGLEPYQESKKGLIMSVLIPGDGEDVVYYVDHRNSEHNYIGSSAVAAKIVESKKEYDWSQSFPAESRPFIKRVDGELRFMWMSTIVTKAGKGDGEYIGGSIPEITLTDASVGKVMWIDQDSLMDQQSWLRQAKGQMKGYWGE